MLQEAGARPAYPTAPAKPDATLVNDWHAVGYSSDVKDGELVPVRLLGQELVLWRHDGKVHLWKDLCIHRGAQLSKGWVIDGKVVCPYHGWRYDGEAKCVFIPAHPDKPPPPRARAISHRCEERYLGLARQSRARCSAVPGMGAAGVSRLSRRSLSVRRQCLSVARELRRRHALSVRPFRLQR